MDAQPNEILSSSTYLRIPAAVASSHGQIDIQNVNGVMSFVDDAGVATPIEAGSSSGSVTSVAATAGGLLVIGGTPTVAPTVGIAAMADKTIIGNGAGSSHVPVALLTSTATGLVMDATTLKNSFSIGIAGGQTLIGGTAASDSLTISSTSNGAKGTVIFGTTSGLVFDELNTILNLGGTSVSGANATFASSGAVNAAYYITTLNSGTGGNDSSSFFAMTDTAFAAAYGTLGVLGTAFTTAGLLTAGTVRVESGAASTKLLFSALGTQDMVWSTTSSRTERMRLTTGGNLQLSSSPFVSFTSSSTKRAQGNGEVMAFAAVPPSQVSGASIALNAYKWDAVTVTITGGTHVTTAAGFNFIDIEAPTYTDSTAVTIDSGATVTIKGAPIAAGSVTLTKALAFWVQDGAVTFGNSTNGAQDALAIASNGQVTINAKQSGGVALAILDPLATGQGSLQVADNIFLGGSGQGIVALVAGATNITTRPSGSVTLTYGAAADGTGGTVMLTVDTNGVTSNGAITLTGRASLGAANLAANNTVATVLGSVGPTGAHTTVQEWMLVKGSGGADRWAPLF